MKAYWDQGE